jgi:hypothetical protein
MIGHFSKQSEMINPELLAFILGRDRQIHHHSFIFLNRLQFWNKIEHYRNCVAKGLQLSISFLIKLVLISHADFFFLK